MNKLAIRILSQDLSKSLVWILGTIYGLVSVFFISHFYSFGLSHSLPRILFPLLALAPLVGVLLISLDASLFRWTALFYGGKATYVRLLGVLACSKLPYFLSLGMWVILMAVEPLQVFILSTSATPFIILFSIAVNLWSFFLLVNLYSKEQNLRYYQAFFNSVLVSCLSFLITCASLFMFRFIYISII